MKWKTRTAAEKALQDLLPDRQRIFELAKYYSNKVDSPLSANESKFYAYLLEKDCYKSEYLVPYLVAERSFVASCSSSWGSDLWRFPGCPATWHEADVTPGGACDPFEEITIDQLREGILKAQARYMTGIPQLAGEFGIIVLDLHNAYRAGWEITSQFFQRYRKFQKYLDNHTLNQIGYQIISKHDDHAVMILPAEPSTYDKYLRYHLQDVNRDIGVVVGISQGPLYYWSPQQIFSDAINRLWLQMRNLPVGAVVCDGPNGHKIADRIGVGNQLQ